MATPSSSATTPSPRLAFLQSGPTITGAASAIMSATSDQTTADERKRAIEKFLAGAELSQLTRGLRARLSYVSFKATHNLVHNTLHDLELQAQTQANVVKTTSSKHARSQHTTTQGSTANTRSSSSKLLARKGSGAAPAPPTASATQSLFSSLLQPPPAKRARTIHNPNDPPIPPPTKLKPATPRKAPATKGSRATTRAQANSQAKAKGGRNVEKGKRKESAAQSAAKGRSRITPQRSVGAESFADTDVDMKAAATLTSLLLSRPSMSVTTSSPRSSRSAGSEADSSHSYAHYAQSSARTTAVTSTGPSQESSFAVPFPRSTTPPLGRSKTFCEGDVTPKIQNRAIAGSNYAGSPAPPSDTEAADLMLFLATSPSPARPPANGGKDAIPLRTLSGGSSLTGRVLFGPGSQESATPTRTSSLRRDYTGSFNSTATELVSESMGGSYERLVGIPATSSPFKPTTGHSRHLSAPSSLRATTQATSNESISHLLPAPASPLRAGRSIRDESPPVSDLRSISAAPPTPGGVPFDLRDFINVSPSPAAPAPPPSSKLSSLRADVGRKLFEEHHGAGAHREGSMNGNSALGACIALAKSPI